MKKLILLGLLAASLPLAASAHREWYRHIMPAPQAQVVAAQNFIWTFSTTSQITHSANQPASPQTSGGPVTPPVTQPVATPSQPAQNATVPTAGNVCVNFGYEPISGSYDLTWDNAQLAKLKAAGINCVRLGFYGQNASVTKPLALAAKSAGFYVEIGNDGDPNSSGYANGVIAEAQWAQANHIDQMSIGNETSKDSQTQTILANLSCQVKQVYSGVVSYDTYLDPNGFDDIKAWASNKGCLDKLGLNTYANYANTYSEAQSLLGAGNWYISEFNKDCDYGQCDNDATWAQGLQQMLAIAKPYNVKINVFAYTAGGDGTNPHWGIVGHPQVMAVLGL